MKKICAIKTAPTRININRTKRPRLAASHMKKNVSAGGITMKCEFRRANSNEYMNGKYTLGICNAPRTWWEFSKTE